MIGMWLDVAAFPVAASPVVQRKIPLLLFVCCASERKKERGGKGKVKAEAKQRQRQSKKVFALSFSTVVPVQLGRSVFS